MAETNFAVNDAFAVKMWSKNLAAAIRSPLDIAPLIGEDENNIIQLKTNTSKGPGDAITYGLVALLQGAGFTENQLAEGNGESLSIYNDQLVINELGHVVGVKSQNSIDQQRVPFNLREQAKNGLTRWWVNRKSVSFFNQVCGFTPAVDPRFTGLCTVTAPTANRKIFAGALGTNTTDEQLGSSFPFTLDLIDRAVEVARVGDAQQRVNPLSIGGKDKYVVYLHPKQVTSLRTNSATGQWQDITKFALSGGSDTKNNPIYTGALGEYNGCILRMSQDVTNGVNSSTGAIITTVRRGVLLGAQAAMLGYGMKGGNLSKYRWNEELFDHKRRLEVSAWSIWGMKKAVYNGQDFGTVTISTYSGG